MAAFTLSLDCEGLWGMADQLQILNSDRINDASLTDAYQFILDTLGANHLKATAAFVTAFAAPAEILLQNLAILDEMALLNPGWFATVLPALKCERLNGWSGAGHYRALSAAGGEMAWHGTTHLPLSETTRPEALELELLLADKLFHALGHTPRTIIFPRNQVGHLNRLRRAGFTTYRASPPGGWSGRVGNLLNEWRFQDNRVAAKPTLKDGWQVSPAGYFLNWPAGVRALIPGAVTVRRWKSLLRAAVERNGYVPMWFHPHNLITAPAMKMVFAEIMREVGQYVRTGDMVNLTIAEANHHFATGSAG